jgi:O-antigen/teichoic acid export membrane protein
MGDRRARLERAGVTVTPLDSSVLRTATGLARFRHRAAVNNLLTMARRWRARLMFAVFDQGAASTANFLQTILYAIWLPLDDFGRYVIVWSISLLIENAQVSVIMDTMPAVVSRFGQRNRQRLDSAGAWIVMIYGALVSLLILAALPFVALLAPAFVLPLLCLAAANPFQRLYIFLRRLCYIRDRQDVAATGSFFYALTLLGGAYALLKLGLLSVEAAILLWGLANLVAVVTIRLLGVVCFRATRRVVIVWLARKLWVSGRWLGGAAIGFWISTWGLFPIIAAMAGTEAAGIVRALQNLFTPIVQFNAAINLAILPRVADKIVAVGPQYARKFALYATAAFTASVVIYGALVMMESKTLLALIYRKPEIADAAYLLWPLGLAMILESSRQGSSIALLAMSRTQMFFWSRVIGISAFLLSALWLGHAMGADGILWANAISQAIGTSILMLEALRIRSPKAPTQDIAAGRLLERKVNA